MLHLCVTPRPSRFLMQSPGGRVLLASEEPVARNDDGKHRERPCEEGVGRGSLD